MLCKCVDPEVSVVLVVIARACIVVMLSVSCDSQAELLGWNMLLSSQLHLLYSILTFLHASHTAVLLCEALGCRGDNHLGGLPSVPGGKLGVSCLFFSLVVFLWS